MADTFRLEIVTPTGSIFDGQALSCIVRTTEGDVGIMKGHTDYVAAIEAGEIKLKLEDGKQKRAATAEGFIHVTDSNVRVLVSSCEWAEDIDIERARADKDRAKAMLAAAKTQDEVQLAKFILKKARVRLRAAATAKSTI